MDTFAGTGVDLCATCPSKRLASANGVEKTLRQFARDQNPVCHSPAPCRTRFRYASIKGLALESGASYHLCTRRSHARATLEAAGAAVDMKG